MTVKELKGHLEFLHDSTEVVVDIGDGVFTPIPTVGAFYESEISHDYHPVTERSPAVDRVVVIEL